MSWTMATGRSMLCAVSACTQLISLLFLCLSVLAPVNAQNRRHEVSALHDFLYQNGLQQVGGYWMTWNFSDENACAWIGVICSTDFTVVELDLAGWALGIQLSTFKPLSRLTDLHHLDLSSNNLSTFPCGVDLSCADRWGSRRCNRLDPGCLGLPVDIGTLTGLEVLDLSQNNFWGMIPAEISACRSLRYLSLDGNGFYGVTPSTLRDLKHLQGLHLAHNQLSGPFPTELTELSNLCRIDLSDNAFNGTIAALPNLTKLVSLTLDNNSFTKFDRSWFSTVSQSLQVLSVSFNQLEGVLPSNITVRDLRVFNMTGNLLSGHIPSISHQQSYPFSLDLSHNEFTGEIPIDLLHTGGSSDCYSMNLSYNFLTGNVPADGSINCFEILDLSHNNLSGLLTLNIFDSISFLWLGNNNLSGDIFDVLNFTSISSEIRLENNLFTGDLSKLPDVSTKFLEVVDLTNNNLHWSASEGIPDPITSTLEKLTGFLAEFRVGGNNFSGTPLPTACFNNPYAPDALLVLDLGGTHLTGEILSTAFNSKCLHSLQYLNLSNNDICSTVPDSIVLLPSLEVLDVSNNNLSGQLPHLLSNTIVNNPRLFEGNNGLCGYPLSVCPQDLQGTSTQTGVQWWVLLVIIGGCVMLALGSCLVATWRWSVYRKRHQQDADLIRTLLERESATIMPLKELRKATENFAQGAQIGEGGFGTVYIGKLNNGTMVAIKRSKREGSLKDKEQFLNEVRILSHINHRNLVKLLGCMKNKVAVLVFEYIPNGTLQEHLSGKIGSVSLAWEQRLKIAAQTADALNYLHSAAAYPIYHRDVKSANILLDDNFNAKVGDFGISKLAPLQATHVSTIAVQGTMGYIDPEYYTSYKLTDKSDVYSFGVVLLELISAKPALDFQRGRDKTSLVYFASSYIEKGDLYGLIDPALIETYNDGNGNGRNSIYAFSKLAMKCLDMQSKARPSMKEVLQELQYLSGTLEGTSKHLEECTNKDDNEDRQLGHSVLLSDFFSEEAQVLPCKLMVVAFRSFGHAN